MVEAESAKLVAEQNLSAAEAIHSFELRRLEAEATQMREISNVEALEKLRWVTNQVDYDELGWGD